MNWRVLGALNPTWINASRATSAGVFQWWGIGRISKVWVVTGGREVTFGQLRFQSLSALRQTGPSTISAFARMVPLPR